MQGHGAPARGPDWLDRAVGAALALALAAAVTAAVRLGAAAGADGGDLLAQTRARVDSRVAAERQQIQPILDAAAREGRGVAWTAAEASLGRLEGNSQLHLFVAAARRESGQTARALREYRRAVELLREYADRRSPHYIGEALAPWLREVRAQLPNPARGDLHYLERALAGGCS